MQVEEPPIMGATILKKIISRLADALVGAEVVLHSRNSAQCTTTKLVVTTPAGSVFECRLADRLRWRGDSDEGTCETVPA